MLNPRKPTFKVTAKDETLDKSYISELGGPFYIIFAVLLAGVGMTVWRIVTQPYDADVTLVVGGWNILNLLMVGCALGVVSERRNPQSTHRVTISRRCDFVHDGEVVPGTIEDVSLGGARIRVVHQAADRIRQDDDAAVRFTPLSDIGADTLPLTVRSFVEDGNTHDHRLPLPADQRRALPADRRSALRQLETVERLPGVAAGQYRHHPGIALVPQAVDLPELPRHGLSHAADRRGARGRGARAGGKTAP